MREKGSVLPQELHKLSEETPVTLDLQVGDQDSPEIAGQAHLIGYERPFPFYFLYDLSVNEQHQGQGHGSSLIEKVNEFLKQKQIPGILFDAIYDDEPATGMYDRHGWQPVEAGSKWRTYNFSDSLSKESLDEVINLLREEHF